MKIKKYLSDLKHMKKQTHYLKILRGILGAIPVIGSLLVEYSPEVKEENSIISKEDMNNLMNFIKDYEKRNEKREEVWFSSDKRCYFLINNKLCEQQGYFIPLMALYSGARLNELCQLYLDDIKKEGKIY